MERLELDPGGSWRDVAMRSAVILRTGGVALLPAEGVYGLHARAEDPEAVERLLALKPREEKKGFIGLIAEPEELSKWTEPNERAHAIAAEQDPEGLVRAIEAIRDRPDSTEAVVGGPPLLVVAGERDPLIPPEVGQALAAAAGGRAEVIAGAGHLPNLERPDEFNRALTSFLSSL